MLNSSKDKPSDVVSVAHAQCWLLIAQLETQMALFSRAFVSLGRSISYAQMLGLHELDRNKHEPNLFSQCPPAQDWIELEERRRTWWVIYVCDRLTSTTSGLPAAINDQQASIYSQLSAKALS